MDQTTYDEIISVLAMHGRPDLIYEFKDVVRVDKDYKPPKYIKRDSLSDSEGSAVSEDDLQFQVDKNGFHSIK